MIRHIPSAVIIFAGCSWLLPAQSTQTMRADIRGGGGDGGKCTIEVEVDGAADVEVRGDMGRIHTLQGQPSRWRRFECNSVMPRNPRDFRFKGVDGRGNVQLVRDPSGAGVAVVRIEDPKGGAEGYTFDLEWSGGSGTYSSDNRYDPYDDGRYRSNRSRRSNDPYRRNDDPYYDDRYSRNRSADSYGQRDEAVGRCQDAVRVQARREQGIRDPYFTSTNTDDFRGNRDRVVGTFEGPQGELYDYNCTVNTNNGNVRAVDIRRRGGFLTPER